MYLTCCGFNKMCFYSCFPTTFTSLLGLLSFLCSSVLVIMTWLHLVPLYYHILLLHCSLSPGDGLGHNCDEMNVLKVKVYRVCGPMVSSRLSTGSSPPLTWPEPPPLSSLPSHFYQTKIFDAVQKYFITPYLCHHHYLS